MIKLNYNNNEYHYNSNGWFIGNDRVEQDLSKTLSLIAYESGVLKQGLQSTKIQKKSKAKKKIKIFDN